jgi:hypothetical protein
MQSFFDWHKNRNRQERPWLILGKGPSYDKHIEYDVSGFDLMSLNHVIDKIKVVAAHMLDLDVVAACEDSIDNNAQVLVMPWVPHVNNRAGELDLSELIKRNPFLARMHEEGRLLYYHHLPTRRFGNSPLVEVLYFSSEAAIDLLAKAGVQCVRTLGVDGGTSYGKSFSDLSTTTLLANGRKTFNKQFGQMAKTIMTTGVDLAPLDVSSPIRVYVATTEAQMLAVKVLEYSIRKHASMSVEVFPMHVGGVDIPRPKDEKNWPRTPFSFQRFIIPELAGYKGRAIYLDSDMQVFKDIKDLWVLPFNDAQVLAVREPKATGRRPQFSVMLLDCEHLDWKIQDIVNQLDTGELNYDSLMYDMAVAKSIRPDINNVWNCLERYDEDETALLHYTDMSSQPWVSRNNPLGYLWFRDLFEAIDDGFISPEYVKEHVNLGYVRPSLWYQVEHRIEDSFLLSKAAKRLDTGYKAAFTTIHSHGASAWISVGAFVKALLRYASRKSGLTAFRKRVYAHFERE